MNLEKNLIKIKRNMKIIKVLRSAWWDLFPMVSFLAIAIMEEKGFWIGGVSLIIWAFTLAIRHLLK